MINLSGPLGITSVSVAGVEYAVADGLVSVKPEHVAALADMGFGPAPVVVSAVADDPNSQPSEDLATMSRNELFAFLKAKGVAVSLPITNDQLRAIAKDTAPASQPVAQPAPEAPAAAVAPEPEAATTGEPVASVAAPAAQ